VARQGHTAIYDPARDRMVVFGGTAAGSSFNDVWALSFAGSPGWTQLTPAGTPPSMRYGPTAIYDPVRDRMVVFGGQVGTNQYSNEVWALNFDTPTPVTVSLASTEVNSDLVRFTWMAEGAVNLRAVVQRSDVGSSEWADLGNPTASGNGQLIFEDRTVQPGASYGYRLAIWEGGAPTILGPEWVTVPVLAVLSLTGVSPNPSERAVAVRFSLPSDKRATLELFDLRGRRVAAREVGALGAGDHFVPITEGQSLPAGVYLVRLTQGHRKLTAKACVVK
jgi:hypothetical protein